MAISFPGEWPAAGGGTRFLYHNAPLGGAGKAFGLTLRTSLERTAPESLTRSLTDFVPYEMSSPIDVGIQYGGIFGFLRGALGLKWLMSAGFKSGG